MKLESQFARYRIKCYDAVYSKRWGVYVQYTDGHVSRHPVSTRRTLDAAVDYAIEQVRRRHHHQQLRARHRAAL